MVTSQAYYDTLKYETFLKDFAGEEVMATSVRDPECPRVAFVSAIMSPSRHSVSPFIFRNYAMPFMVTSNYRQVKLSVQNFTTRWCLVKNQLILCYSNPSVSPLRPMERVRNVNKTKFHMQNTSCWPIYVLD